MVMWSCDLHLVMTLCLTLRLVLPCPHSGGCTRQQYVAYKGMTSRLEYLAYRGPWRYSDCERLCRQYVECLAFVVEWVDSRFGYCGVIRGRATVDSLAEKSEHTLYGETMVLAHQTFSTGAYLRSCQMSSYYDLAHTCVAAMDGDGATFWQAKETSTNEWLEVQLAAPRFVVGVGMSVICEPEALCLTWVINYYNAAMSRYEATRDCSIECPAPTELYTTSPALTERVRVTCADTCVSNMRVGISELLILVVPTA